jgi:hypothetical protein
LIRNAEGTVELARLGDGRVVTARWHKHAVPCEVVVEWSLFLDGRALMVRDKKTGMPALVALHRWDEGHPRAVDAVRADDGTWRIEVPMAWHNMCASFSGKFVLELDAERGEILYSDEIHVEI